jgi:divalent metal cation (Fe/Co/Zn/Cd) transporter
LSLAGLGITVLLDVGSSMVLIWRFRHERSGRSSVEHAERVAHRVAAASLVGFGVLLAASSARELARGSHPDASALGVTLAAVSVAALPVLARLKYRAAAAVESAALRADAHLTAVGAGSAVVTLLGLGLVAVFGWWWTDAAAALILAGVALRQGVRGLRDVTPP